MKLDPDQLLLEAKAGEPNWEAIFVVVREPMRRAARSAMLTMGVDDVPAVEDAVVLGWIRLQKYGLEDRFTLIGFARSVAHYAGKDIAKKAIRDREFSPDEPPIDLAALDPTPEDLVVITEEEAVAQELSQRRHDAAMACLEALTPGQREAVVEVEMEGKSDTQLAEETGVSHTAIWKRRTKGIDNLRICVEARLSSGSNAESDEKGTNDE